ncbi:MAG: helix-turn-helix transcriptional regulator [Chloroflexi bacterium]|nr:helix-turn-helix transcriptional regulator [Chloroflexota bacterium]
MGEQSRNGVNGFGQALEQLMVRADVWDSALARRLGASRSEVYRWRTGRALPSRRNLARLEAALRWTASGEPFDLDSAERDRLYVLAGHGTVDVDLDGAPDSRNRVELPDRCAVYAYQYGPRSFPSQWSVRGMEIEQQIQGTVHAMLHRPPTFLRPDSVTQLYYRWYDADVVDRYAIELRERRRRWEHRIEEYEVRQIYSKPLLAEYLRSRRWQGLELSREQVHEQITMLVDLLDRCYPNFAIGLDEDVLPFDATIVGHEVVLLTLRQAQMVNAAGWTIFGMEMTGLSVVKTFSQAFDRTWGKRTLTKDPSEVKAWLTTHLEC